MNELFTGFKQLDYYLPYCAWVTRDVLHGRRKYVSAMCNDHVTCDMHVMTCLGISSICKI